MNRDKRLERMRARRSLIPPPPASVVIWIFLPRRSPQCRVRASGAETPGLSRHALRIRVGPAGFPPLGGTGGVRTLTPPPAVCWIYIPRLFLQFRVRARAAEAPDHSKRALGERRRLPGMRLPPLPASVVIWIFSDFCLPLLLPISGPRFRRRGPNHSKHAQGERRQLPEMMLKTVLVRLRLLFPPPPASAVLRIFLPRLLLQFRVRASGAEAPGQHKHAQGERRQLPELRLKMDLVRLRLRSGISIARVSQAIRRRSQLASNWLRSCRGFCVSTRRFLTDPYQICQSLATRS